MPEPWQLRKKTCSYEPAQRKEPPPKQRRQHEAFDLAATYDALANCHRRSWLLQLLRVTQHLAELFQTVGPEQPITSGISRDLRYAGKST
eukprot:CAMPEP_0179101072 /NCGR_PEP_ID=MMETSP0796-20121207/46712_1 /TAXON_ID=73915 /ORGANISM="Pyrodinium bahamense, Strain pbaha01" /LENGTH=89 /DNA_ID=CAMNT_0020798913 /DNA_START=39 /DNA_END=305 /DNA_ORIENTATION=-